MVYILIKTWNICKANVFSSFRIKCTGNTKYWKTVGFQSSLPSRSPLLSLSTLLTVTLPSLSSSFPSTSSLSESRDSWPESTSRSSAAKLHVLGSPARSVETPRTSSNNSLPIKSWVSLVALPGVIVVDQYL